VPPTEPYDDAPPPDTIDPRTLAIALNEPLPEDRAVALDCGAFTGWPRRHRRDRARRRRAGVAAHTVRSADDLAAVAPGPPTREVRCRSTPSSIGPSLPTGAEDAFRGG
jgi:hypothetical protein